MSPHLLDGGSDAGAADPAAAPAATAAHGNAATTHAASANAQPSDCAAGGERLPAHVPRRRRLQPDPTASSIAGSGPGGSNPGGDGTSPGAAGSQTGASGGGGPVAASTGSSTAAGAITLAQPVAIEPLTPGGGISFGKAPYLWPLFVLLDLIVAGAVVIAVRKSWSKTGVD